MLWNWVAPRPSQKAWETMTSTAFMDLSMSVGKSLTIEVLPVTIAILNFFNIIGCGYGQISVAIVPDRYGSRTTMFWMTCVTVLVILVYCYHQINNLRQNLCFKEKHLTSCDPASHLHKVHLDVILPVTFIIVLVYIFMFVDKHSLFSAKKHHHPILKFLIPY